MYIFNSDLPSKIDSEELTANIRQLAPNAGVSISYDSDGAPSVIAVNDCAAVDRGVIRSVIAQHAPTADDKQKHKAKQKREVEAQMKELFLNLLSDAEVRAAIKNASK